MKIATNQLTNIIQRSKRVKKMYKKYALFFSVFTNFVVTNYAMEHGVKEVKNTSNYNDIKTIDEVLGHISKPKPALMDIVHAIGILGLLKIEKIEKLDSADQLKMFLELVTTDEDRAFAFLLHATKFNGNATDENGTPLLLRCIEDNSGENVVRELLERKADAKVQLTHPNRAPILAATMLGKVGVVKLLLNSGADAAVTTDKSETPLQIAIDKVIEYSDQKKFDTAQTYGQLISLFLAHRDNYSIEDYFDNNVGYLADYDDNSILHNAHKQYLQSCLK